MKKTFKNENKNNKIKHLAEKIKIKSLTDEIETKDTKIKEINKKLKEIKSNSLKEFVYANRMIPECWKNKLTYQSQVLELFANDRNFLSYVGNVGGTENDNLNKINTKTSKIKFRLKNIEKPMFFKSESKIDINNIIGDNYKKNLPSNKSRNYSFGNIKNKLKHYKNNTLDEKQLTNIIIELHNNYPIKDKLKELFSEKLIKSINLKNRTMDINDNNNKQSKFKPEKRRNIFRENIFVNLISTKSKHPRRVQSAFKNNGYKKDGHLMIKNKYNIENEDVMNQLESINFFGPYYSYCPPCGNRNIDFYKNLDKKKLIQIVQQIKKKREKEFSYNLTERRHMIKI